MNERYRRVTKKPRTTGTVGEGNVGKRIKDLKKVARRKPL